jgi:primosomal protein N' (replication factor Y)
MACAHLRAEFGDDAVHEAHGDLTPSALWKAWQSALEGTASIFVGTRMAIALPIRSRSLILMHECESQDFKQYDQNPRFDTRTAALQRTSAGKHDLVFMSHAPRVEEYALTLRDGLHLHEPTTEERPVTLAGISFTLSANNTNRILTPTAIEACKSALQGEKTVVIFHNRRGMSGALYCKDCGKISRCDRCQTTLVVHDSGLHCHRCALRSSVPGACRSCGGIRLYPIGFGAAGLEQLLRTTFPEARILRRDAETKSDSQESATNANILIGTQLLLHDLAEHANGNKPIGAIIATNIDDLLAHPDFRATENAWRTVRLLRDLAANNAGAETVLQTFDPENPRIRQLLEPYANFMRTELEDRKIAGYPPTAVLIAITARGVTEQDARLACEAVKRDIASANANDPLFRVTGPHRPSQPFRHGAWRAQLVIRTTTVTPLLTETLMKLPETYLIERDPESPL